MYNSAIFGTFLILAVFIIFAYAFWLRKRRQQSTSQPIIELEKLVNCRACGSLIPEEVRRCAFCGAWQHLGMSENSKNG